MTSISKKIIMACSGIILSLFIIVHALGNTSIMLGRSCFESYASSLHDLGFALVLVELVLAVFFVFHVLTGLNLWWENGRARQMRYQVDASAGGRTAGSRTMPYTGLLLLGFILYHVFAFYLIDSNGVVDLLRIELTTLPGVVFYLAAIIALFLHLSHGLTSIWQSLGLDFILRILPVNLILMVFLILITMIFLGIIGYALLADGFLL